MTLLRILTASLLVSLNTLLHSGPLFALALLKALVPARLRTGPGRWLLRVAESWIAVNSALIDRMTSTRFIVDGLDGLRRDGQYLVLANHQSWVDIPVLQKLLNRRIPLLRFFLKSELFWVPILGLAWWALDFPFMKRYSRERLRRHPELAGRDLEATRRALERFGTLPVAVMNFVEGTRWSPAKHAQQRSPYRHLLKPRAGGVGFVLGALGERLDAILDVTLVYPRGQPRLVDLFANRIREVRVELRSLPVPAEFIGMDYAGDAAARERFQDWINQLWREKDARIEALRAPAAGTAVAI